MIRLRSWLVYSRAAAILLAALVPGWTSASAQKPAAGRTVAPLVHLPADQANHPTAHNEWWYVVGHLRSGKRTFGFEVTLFRFSHLQLPGSTAQLNLDRTDIAITDENGRHFYQRVTLYFPQSAHFSNHVLDTRIGKDSLSGPTPHSMALRASLSAGAINLHLSSRRPPMYVGGRGYLPLGNGYTYYYSLTDLATSGTLHVGSRTFEVTGTSWLDHQWGNWSWTSIKGWTWMALQLDDGVQMSIFDFRGTNTRVRGASVLLANGKLRTIRTATVTALGHWRSPNDGALYPSGWVVRIPALHAVFHVSPTLRNQELTTASEVRGNYWEGSGRLSGTVAGKPVTGLAYTELTGYAK